MVAKFKTQKRKDYKAPDFTAVSCELTFDLSDEATRVSSLVRYRRLSSDKKAPLMLNGEDLKLVNVTLDGGGCKYVEKDGMLVIDDVPDEFELAVENIIAPAHNSELMGLYKSDGCFCTQCEPEGFRRITYFLDRPDVLCRYRVTVIGPEYGYGVLLSNGNLVEKGIKKGRNYAVWDDPFPKPSYLFALVAGTFDIINDVFITKSGRKVDLYLFVDRGSYERGLWAMQSVKDAMKWDEERFGLEYDLDNFKVVAVDFFNQGAMENKSLNIFNSVYVMVDPDLASDEDFYDVQSVIGHEYFHNYTGDRVTLRDWFQLSLKESLTVFRDQEFSSDTASHTMSRLNAVSVIRGPQFDEDSSPTAHCVRPEQVSEMNNFYTVTIYDKGAEIIRMIHTLIGEENFRAGLSEYLTLFDGKAATVDDFVACMEKAGNVDLKQFCRWYSMAGTPRLKAEYSYDAKEGRFVLTLSQLTPQGKEPDEDESMVIPVRLSFLSAKDGHRVKLHLTGNGDADHALTSRDDLLILDQDSRNFCFAPDDKEKLDDDDRIVPVLLEDFSAPVKFSTPYSDEDLALMMRYGTDPFTVYDASVQLQNRYVMSQLKSDQLEEPSAFIEAASGMIARMDENSDLILMSKVLAIQPLTALMQIFDGEIDLDRLSQVQKALGHRAARVLENDFARIYTQVKAASPKYSVKDMGRRKLNNLALYMLAMARYEGPKRETVSALVLDHYRNARCMTDRLGAMRCAADFSLPCAEQIYSMFEKSYGHYPLVMDNYFRIRAAVPDEETVFTVRKLLKHPAFDDKNPNRVRALVGTMARSNPVALHRKDGAGYHLLSSLIRRYNDQNAMLAASLVTPLLQFRRFDKERATIMRDDLEQLFRMENLSRGLSEKIEAALK